jgi:predicted AAA+ superfamily ATPase
MPHQRPRHLQESFDKLISHARIIGILGHRQTGKTTFLQNNAAEYVTLDDEDVFTTATKSPKEFINSLKAKRSGIDECQLVPGLFPALKVKIGTSSIPGRFILTGSVRFTSRKAIRESLTGRISNLELLPFCLTEIESEPNSSVLINAIKAHSLKSLINSLIIHSSLFSARTKSIEKYMTNGGLPGLFNIRDDKTRKSQIADILETILDRDLRLIYKTSLPYRQIFDYCQEIAASPLTILRPTTIRKKVRLQESTQKHLLYALEAVFLIRRIPVEGDYKGDLFWFEDQIERSYFNRTTNSDIADWITLVYRNARAQFQYRLGEHTDYFHYRTRGGAMVPICIRTNDGELGLFPVLRKSDVTLSLKRSAESFLKRYSRSKVLFITRYDKEVDIVNDRIGIIPSQIALF